FFDVTVQGEGLADVGTHLVDLVPWLLFPGQHLDVERDVRLLRGRRWPTWLTAEQFARVTGLGDFPEALAGFVTDGRLAYWCNNAVTYALRGVHVGLDVRWDFESAGGGDTHFAAVSGTRSRVEVRQGPEEGHRPEVYVVPREPEGRAGVGDALRAKVAR